MFDSLTDKLHSAFRKLTGNAQLTQKNISEAMEEVRNALLSADLALAGMVCPVPPDQVLEAMYRTGKSLPPTLRETALGGLAGTKAGQEIAREIHGA